jgi:hypothetical protein
MVILINVFLLLVLVYEIFTKKAWRKRENIYKESEVKQVEANTTSMTDNAIPMPTVDMTQN